MSQRDIGMEPGGSWELEAVMREFQAPLLRYAGRILNDPAAAQDVVQDAFIKLVKSRRGGSEDPKNMSSWLYRVTHNCAIDYIRRESRLRTLHQEQSEEVNTVSAPKQQRDLEKQEALRLALERLRKLEPHEQQVVVLRVDEGLSYKQIAEVTGRTVGNVGCILHNALKKLALELKQAGAI